MNELETPLPAVVIAFSEMDRVGRLKVSETGEELRFGSTACKGFMPNIGDSVFVTAVAPHPLGGNKAAALRPDATTEAQVRGEAALASAEQAVEEARAKEQHRIAALPVSTPDAIARRIREAVMPEEDYEADKELLYRLTDDLDAVGPQPAQVSAILKGIAESHPLAHFGNPGPLIHFMERVEGYEKLVLATAEGKPRAHFLWMLARIVNGDSKRSQEAREILARWLSLDETPDALGTEVKSFLSDTPG